MGSKKKQEMVTYSLRVPRERWALFSAIAALKGASALDLLRDMIERCISENGNILSSAAKEADKKAVSESCKRG